MINSQFRLPAYWWQWLGYIGIALLVGFMWLPASYFLMVISPWNLIWQGGFLCLGISLWGMLGSKNISFRPLGYGLDWAIAGVILACILSTIVAPFKTIAIGQLFTTLGYGAALYASRNYLGLSGWSWQNIWRSLTLFGFGLGIWSLVGWYFSGQLERNFFPFGHHNFVAAYFCLVLPLAFSYALSQTKQKRILLLLATSLFPLNIYLGASRGAFIGLLVWAIASAAVMFRRTKGRQRLIWMAIATAIVSFMLVMGLQHPRVQRIIQIKTDQGNIPQIEINLDGEGRDRLLMWQTGLNILRDRPLTGVGPGNMSRIYNLYRPIEAGTGASHVQQLHSTPIHLLAELGLIGGAAITFLITQLVRLGIRIYGNTQNPKIHILLYGIGGAWLAYGSATLSDYQLENIPIGFTLLMTIVLLIALADKVLPSENSQNFSTTIKHFWRWGTAVTLVIAASFMAIALWSSHLSHQGHLAWQQGEKTKAIAYFSKAQQLKPENPTNALTAAFLLRDDPESETLDQELAVEHLKKALAATPNDFYLNQNLGIILSEQDPILAQPYLERSIQLLPRDHHHSSYFLLASSYLAQGEQQKAIAALALQGLIDPEYLTLGNWDNTDLKPIRIDVVEKCLSLYQKILDSLPKDHSQVIPLQQQMAWISWWHNLPIPHLENLSGFDPALQILLAEQQPELAQSILSEQLSNTPNPALKWLMLQSWFDSDAPLEINIQGEFGQTTLYFLSAPTSSDINLQSWLKQIVFSPPKQVDRIASQLTYRDQAFTNVDQILYPKHLKLFRLVSVLGLNGDHPRTFPELDRLIQRITAKKLGLTHPTHNNFQLIHTASEGYINN